MVLNFLFTLFTLFTSFALAQDKTITVAVIDTGFGATQIARATPFLCKQGHRDFTTQQTFLEKMNTTDAVPTDEHGHGTNIAGVIIANAPKNAKFCLVILKYYSPNAPGNDNMANTIKAIEFARQIKADYINYSGGGEQFSRAEAKAVKAYLDGGGKFVAAAGNENKYLAKTPYYPAMDDKRVIVVGNWSNSRNFCGKSHTSNYGERITRWEHGESVDGFGLFMTGTSQAAAVATGKLLGEKEQNLIKLKKRSCK